MKKLPCTAVVGTFLFFTGMQAVKLTRYRRRAARRWDTPEIRKYNGFILYTKLVNNKKIVSLTN